MSPLVRYALPALAAAGSAYAACSASATATIQNSGDASAIASCKTFSGSIAVETGAAGPIALDGVQKIDGDLVITNNSQIRGISADSLEEITGTFELNEVQVLDTVSFPKLTTVNALSWISLPNLQALGFGSKVTKASKIDIQNTQLQSLEGIDVVEIDYVKIANNRYINDITMQLGNISESLTLEANNPEVNVSFPNLIWANNMTFRNCSSVEIQSLKKVNLSLNLIGNVLTSFAAPNLTEVGGALAFTSNFELTNISLPLLEKVKADLVIANNTKLNEIDGLPQLQTIGGAFDFFGNFSSVSVPELKDVKGAFNLQSTGEVQQTCDDKFEPLKKSGKIQGKFVCKGKLEKVGGEGTDPGKSKDGDKKGAASALTVQGSVVLAGVAAAFFL